MKRCTADGGTRSAGRPDGGGDACGGKCFLRSPRLAKVFRRSASERCSFLTQKMHWAALYSTGRVFDRFGGEFSRPSRIDGATYPAGDSHQCGLRF
jgi:hypothetical protein